MDRLNDPPIGGLYGPSVLTLSTLPPFSGLSGNGPGITIDKPGAMVSINAQTVVFLTTVNKFQNVQSLPASCLVSGIAIRNNLLLRM